MKAKNINKLRRARRRHLAVLRLAKQWNRRLSDMGLSVDRGRSRNLVYVGDLNNLKVIEQLQKDVGTN